MSWLLTILLVLGFMFDKNVSEAARHHPKRKLPSSVVVGTVYCDTCFRQDFSKTSHFISGALVAVECGETSTSDPTFRQEVKTDEKGEFKVHLPFVVSKHVKKIEGCSVKLLRSSEPYCGVASSATSSSLCLKSKEQGTHIFSAGFFTFKPLNQPDLCDQKPSITNSKKISSISSTVLRNPNGSPFPPFLEDPPEPSLPPLPELPKLPPLTVVTPLLPPSVVGPSGKLAPNSDELSLVQNPNDLAFPPSLQDPPEPFLPPLPELPKLPPLPVVTPLLPPSVVGPPDQKLTPNSDELSNEKTGFPFPPNPFNPPVLPPNPLLPPPSIFPPLPFQPPPSVIPPIFPSPPPSLFPPINIPPLPGLIPSPPPPPPSLFPPIPHLPPFPFQPAPGFPGVPPASSSKKSSP